MAWFGSKRSRARNTHNAAELALDLTPEAIVLYERAAGGPWRKFASAALDDPELPIVIGLLRSEAEGSRGLRRPVRLWLPPDQVLCYRAPIRGATAHDRLRAGFDFVATETVYRPGDVAIAVAQSDAGGNATILLTYTSTWNEARSYAVRWGFLPGPVSTRHQAEEFGEDGPDFQMAGALDAPPTRDRRPVLAAGAGLAAAVLAVAAWLNWPAPEPLPEPAPQTEATPVATAQMETSRTGISWTEAPEPARAWMPAPAGPEGVALPESAGPGPALDGGAPSRASAASPAPEALAPPYPVAQAPGSYSPPPPPRAAASLATAQAGSSAGDEGGPAPAAARTDTAAGLGPGPQGRSAPASPWSEPAPGAPPSAVPHPGEALAGDRLAAFPLPTPRPDSILRKAEVAAMAAALPVPRPKSRARPAASLPKLAAPSPPKIARGATQSGLPLDQTAFIGVISLHSGRKALLRLPDGSVRSVAVGDILDGWRVSAIGAEQMRMSRNGRDRTLLLVSR